MELTLRALGDTGLMVTPLGLGTVKLGRTGGLKYPAHLPSDRDARALLDTAKALGINLLDTAPAYGTSEERLGGLLRGERDQWVISTKVGETFDGQASHFDFSPEGTRASVARSLARLHTDYLDIVLIHSDGSDREILERWGTLDVLLDLKKEGIARAVGISHKTADGARLAVAKGAGVIMATLNRADRTEAQAIEQAAAAGCGVLIKKALASGQGSAGDLRWVASQSGVHSIVVGTTNPDHLRANARAVA